MAIDRFYLENLDTDTLSGDEARHCIQVLRHGAGDKIVLFDGHGKEVMAEIITPSRDSLSFKKINEAKTAQPDFRLVLAQAVPKGKNMDLIIQKATELGVAEIHPVLSSRTVVQVDDERADAKTDKWRQTVVEACKQCGQNWLPTLHTPKSADDFLAAPPKSDLLLVGSLQPGARSIKQAFSDFESEKGRRPQSITMLIGPEGDFTPAELSRANSAGFQPVTLGRIILRCETAAIYCMSVLSHELQG